MADDIGASLTARFLAEATDAAALRQWDLVLDLVEDVLVLDGDNHDALVLRTLAERHTSRADTLGGRRHETVLFADLVASTSLANRFDPEIVRHLIHDYEQACTPVLTALGGHIHRFVGDGILASFGFPTSHEDDAARAVQAGLDLVEAVARTSAASGRRDAELHVRVGIASGILVHADRGVGRWSQPADLFGPAVNLAARLHDVAEPDQVCLSEETARLVAGLFELAPAGTHALKGFDAPVVVQLVVRRAEGAAGQPSAAFVDRDAELARLRSLWTRADADPAGTATVFVTGDAGVGKSRLVAEFTAPLAGAGPAPVELRCAAYRSTTPLYPVRKALERQCGIEPADDDATRLAKLAAGVDHAAADALVHLALALEIGIDGHLDRPESSPVQLYERTLALLHDWLSAPSSRPRVLIVEDLHWADPSTRDLLGRVLRSAAPGLLTVVTSRTAPELAKWIECEELAIAPLSTADASRLARATSTDLPDETVADVARRSDGIPLFVEQLTASLARAETRHGYEIPLTLTDLLQARLDAAGPSKLVAQLASVAGREFEPELVETMAGRLAAGHRLPHLDRPVRDHLDRLLESRLVEAVPGDGDRLRFRHALVGEAAYESQLRAERPERHEALARILIERGPKGRPRDPAVVARHLERAGRPTESIAQYLDAATRGRAAGAYAEVKADLDCAEALLDQVPRSERDRLELDVRLSRGLAESSAGGYAAPGVITDFRRAVDICRALPDADDDGMLRALLGLWTYYLATGDLTTAHDTSAMMEAHLERGRMPAARPSFHACRGVELFYAGRLPQALSHLTNAVELFQVETIDRSTWPLPHDPVAASLAFLGPLRYTCGDEKGGLEAIALGAERCRNLDFPVGPFSLAFVRNYEAWMHRARGSWAEAETAAAEVLRIGEQHGFFDWVMTGRMHQAAAVVADRPTADAVDELGSAIADWQAVGARIGLPALLVEQARGHLRLGDPARADAVLAAAEALVAEGQELNRAEAHLLRAELLAEAKGPAHPAVRGHLEAGFRFAHAQGAHLFVVACGAAMERWLGPDHLDGETRRVLDEARAAMAEAAAVGTVRS